MHAAMTFDTAMQRLLRLCGGELDTTVLVDCLEVSKRPDEYGFRPTDTGWTPTYDLDYAAAEAWDYIAAENACDFDFAADGSDYKRSQAHQHALERATYFRRRVVHSPGPRESFVDVIGN